MNLTFENIYSNISPEQLKTSKIIVSALGAGMTLFFGITLFFYFSNYTPDPNILEEPQNLTFLKYACILVFIITLIFSYIQPFRVLKNDFEAIKNSEPSQIDIDGLLGIHRTYLIIRLALLEGGGLFGLVVFLMSVLNYIIYSFPIYWVCTIPALVMILFIIILYPTKSKVSNFIIENMT